MTFPHHAQMIFIALGAQAKEGRGPAAFVPRPSEGPTPKHDRTAPIWSAWSAVIGVKISEV